MFRRVKYLLFCFLIAAIAVFTFSALRNKVIFVANKTSLDTSSVKDYVLSLYARYQLQPDSKHLNYSLHLLLNSDSITLEQKRVLESMIDYIEKHPSASDTKIISQVAQLKTTVPQHELSFMGLKLSKFIKENSTALQLSQQIINNIRWAVITHNNELFQSELHKLEKMQIKANNRILSDLSRYNVSSPKLPWFKWLQQLSG